MFDGVCRCASGPRHVAESRNPPSAPTTIDKTTGFVMRLLPHHGAASARARIIQVRRVASSTRLLNKYIKRPPSSGPSLAISSRRRITVRSVDIQHAVGVSLPAERPHLETFVTHIVVEVRGRCILTKGTTNPPLHHRVVSEQSWFCYLGMRPDTKCTCPTFLPPREKPTSSSSSAAARHQVGAVVLFGVRPLARRNRSCRVSERYPRVPISIPRRGRTITLRSGNQKAYGGHSTLKTAVSVGQQTLEVRR